MLVFAIFYWVLAVLIVIQLRPLAKELVLYMIEIFAGVRPSYTNSLERLVSNTTSFKGLDEDMLGISIGISLAYLTLRFLGKKWLSKQND